MGGLGRLEHWGRVVSWLLIALAFLWLCLIAVPQFVDRISKHEDAWQREWGHADMVSEKFSEGD